MFENDWAQKGAWEREKRCLQYGEPCLTVNTIHKTLLLYWEEHCSECAAPYCYENCPNFIARAEKNCGTFVYGIYLNHDFNGLFNFGADIRFRKWGKLETILYGQSVSVFQHRLLQNLNRFIVGLLNLVSGIIRPVDPKRILNRAKTAFGVRLFGKMPKINSKIEYDEFVLSCFSSEEEPFRLILEYKDKREKFRYSFDIMPGPNFYTLSTEYFTFESSPPEGRISIYPENGDSRRLIFTWLDFVKYKEGFKDTKWLQVTGSLTAAEKVKCVAWDLDNTLWKGILTEDTENGLVINSRAVELIKKLDERGIIQTIVSKNNYADAWSAIEKFGLQDYFVYPAINWTQKSLNLKLIAKKLNLNINTFALIDDSPFERAEVRSALPQVRVYPAEYIPQLTGYDEFDSPVTTASKLRRSSYLAEMQRDIYKESFASDYENFLRSCGIEMRIFIPREEEQVLRCLELLQRTNKLNLSGKRYTQAEFDELISESGMLCIAMECKDRFGNYGIIGFASVDERGEAPVLKNLVISCRMIQKRVEQTFIEWLAFRESQRGMNILMAEIVETELNRTLLRIIEDMSFEVVDKDNAYHLMKLPLDKKTVIEDIIDLQVDIGSR